jgi:hypothetical protein
VRTFMAALSAAATPKEPPPPTPPAYLAAWREKLKDLRGDSGRDGWEYIATDRAVAALGLPPSIQAARKLAPVMAELGWTQVRKRGLRPWGPGTRVRGYVRKPQRPTVDGEP